MKPIKGADIQVGDYIQAEVYPVRKDSAWDKTIFQVKQIKGLELYSYIWADYRNGIVKIDKRGIIAHLQVDRYVHYRFYKLSEDEFLNLAGKHIMLAILD